MSRDAVNRVALAVTIAICLAVDGGFFWLGLLITDDIAQTIWAFVAAGAPATLVLSWPMYSYLRGRIGSDVAT
jgi:hypothetical protein